MSRAAALFALVSVFFLFESLAAAQGAPDIVRLRDGSFVRGTIVERTEGVQVSIQTVTGDVRTFPMADVTYAGPDQSQVPAPPQYQGAYPSQPPPPMPAPGTVQLTFTGTAPGLMAQRLTGTATASVWTGRGVGFARVDAFEPLCLAPCQIAVQPGTYQFGISQGEGNAVRARGGPFTVTSDMAFELDFESRDGLRVLGWLTFTLSAVASAVIILVPLMVNDYSDTALYTSLGVSLGVLAVGTAVGLPFIFLNDHSEVRVAGVPL